ncbi:glycoside hydrolase superfamily [Mortierella sp. GBAus27b]|nr:glycoside hydrolase superfamily [Mortierella sp. GBAus27b]
MLAKLSLLTLLCGAATALVHGVDNSAAVPLATYAKARGEGFTHLVIRGYQEACGVGGQVDPNFVANYNNARAAGYTNIDTYWFPCTGTSNRCKSFATQISELGAAFKAHDMKIGRIWLDLEQDSTCKAWNYGFAGNLAKAKEIVAALKASGYKWGIYSSPGEWGNLFGSRGVVLDNTVPLWFATYDNVQTLALKQPFGGWTSAVGKQYTDKSASGLFDLNVLNPRDDNSLIMKLPFGGWTSAFGKQYTDQSASGMSDLNVLSS